MLAILIAGAVALMSTLLGTRLAIKVLVSKGYGQLIRDDGPTSHHVKRGTPTMGGLVILVAVVIGYGAGRLQVGVAPSASALLLLFLFVGLGAIGFLDDYIKISRQRSLGLRSKAKMVGQISVGLVFALLAIRFEDENGDTPITHAISFTRDLPGWELPTVLLVVWVLILIAGGISLGAGMQMTGLDKIIVQALPIGPGSSGTLVVVVLVLATVLMSTFMSNTAAANLLLPIGISAAVTLGDGFGAVPLFGFVEVEECVDGELEGGQAGAGCVGFLDAAAGGDDGG